MNDKGLHLKVTWGDEFIDSPVSLEEIKKLFPGQALHYFNKKRSRAVCVPLNEIENHGNAKKNLQGRNDKYLLDKSDSGDANKIWIKRAQLLSFVIFLHETILGLGS